ncbi:hypothetical protein HMI55_002553 [Coelomomyces lativittatus]|nr:hypothetical protein HMI55_002553 [Coelomomyces lativittatus]
MIFGTTSQFRSRASVDLLWEQTVNNISKLIQDCISEKLDPELFISINNFMFGFAQTLQAYGFSLSRITELLYVVFEKYSELLKIKCSETLLKVQEEDSLKSAMAADEEEYDRYYKLFKFRKIQKSHSSKSFPRVLPFSILVPLCYDSILQLIQAFYQFSTDFSAINSYQDSEDVLQKAIDNVLIRYLHQPLMSKVETSENLKEVLQVLTDLEYFINICEEFEYNLMERRTERHSGRVILQMTQIFRDSHKKIEERIFKLLNLKITEFLSTADYEFMPPNSTSNKMPSIFLRDAVNFLTTVMYSALENLTDDIKSIIYFEIFDHLSSGVLKIILSPNVRRINMYFVEQFATDVGFLERFISGLNDPNIKEAFTELQQTVTLLTSENPMEYLDPSICNKRYNRLKPETVLALFEKLSNAAGLFAHKVDKNKRKAYDTIIVTLKKKVGDSAEKKTVLTI